jgi:N-acetylneuraminic acid mutarotase
LSLALLKQSRLEVKVMKIFCNLGVMKKHLAFFIILAFFGKNFAQNFTWVRGSNTSSITGTYAGMGAPSTSANPGGRHGCATWTDASGNLWLFGGEGYSSTFPLSWLNDLWKYNPNTNQWTWVRGSNGPNAVGVYGTQGVASVSNEPGAREFAMYWTDAAGNFWLFGGDGFAANSTFGRLGDLWKYNPSTNQWTWMKGFNTVVQNGIYGTLNVSNSANMPGCRYYGATWADANNLYLFGGRGFGASGTNGYLNDFWKYNIATNNWIWIGGSQNTFVNGTYGTQGVASTANIPGGRGYASAWTDASGNFYLFGGLGLGASGTQSYLNDLWKFNSTNNTWTWLHGSNSTGSSGSYGFKGISSPIVVPGARYGAAAWSDLQGNLWLFGGQGYDSTITSPYLNDLFRYEPSNNRWTWMKGPKIGNNNGNYGVMGVAAPSNLPGSRLYNDFWRDNHQTFWLFGGEGLDISNNNYDHMNDLWGYIPPCNPDSIQAGISNICSGGTATLTAYTQYSSSVQWYNSPTSTTSIGSGSVFASPSLSAAGSPSVYTFYAQANSCTMTPRTAQNITVYPIPSPSISGNAVICNGAFVTLNASGAGSYTWSTGSNATSITVNPSSTTTYTLQGSNNQFCSGSSIKTVTVNASPPVQILGPNQICIGSTVVLTATGALTYTWNNGSNSNSISISPTLTGNYQLNGIDANGCFGSGSKTITVNALPTITAVANRSVICRGETTTLTATGANTYTWSNSVVAPSIVITPTMITQNLIIYTVTGTSSLLCENNQTVSVKVLNCVDGLNESALSADVFNIYPNPNKGAFNLDVIAQLPNLFLHVYDALGQLVYAKEMTNGHNSIDLMVSPGIYYYRLQNNTRKTGGKIIIQP